jgi:ABC-type sulfate transport system substrate-binding protein
MGVNMTYSKNKLDATIQDEKVSRNMNTLFILAFVLAIMLFFWFSYDQPVHPKPRVMTLYSYSAFEPVMEEAILPAFKDYWFQENQEELVYITTFAGSGVISRLIMTRFPAEIALLASELDARVLEEQGIIPPPSATQAKPYVRLCESPLVLIARDDFPLKAMDPVHLTPDSLHVIIPDPYTSGAGQMATLALYLSMFKVGGSHEEALSFAKSFFYQGEPHPSDARAALASFKAGEGDLLISYESAGRSQGLKVINPDVVLVSVPIALSIPKNISADQEPLIQSFLTFLTTEESILAFSDYGFRSVDSTTPGKPRGTRIEALGSPIRISRDILDPIMEQRIRLQ